MAGAAGRGATGDNILVYLLRCVTPRGGNQRGCCWSPRTPVTMPDVWHALNSWCAALNTCQASNHRDRVDRIARDTQILFVAPLNALGASPAAAPGTSHGFHPAARAGQHHGIPGEEFNLFMLLPPEAALGYELNGE